VACQVYNDAAQLLLDEYRVAAERVAQASSSPQSRGEPGNHLGEHLMVMYWREIIKLNDTVLTAFYANASDSVLGHAMWFVGRVFSKDPGAPAEMIERLRALWEWRRAMI
jgi:hypothetical protein